MEQEKKPVGRPPRKEVVKKERRRRNSLGPEAQMRMAVPQDYIDYWKDYELRWINDQKGRIRQKTVNDDWDICYQHELPDAPQVGSDEQGKPIIVEAAGVGADNRPFSAYLCRKRKEYHEEDKRARQAEIDKQEKSILNYESAAGDGLNPQDGNVYVPSKP